MKYQIIFIIIIIIIIIIVIMVIVVFVFLFDPLTDAVQKGINCKNNFDRRIFAHSPFTFEMKKNWNKSLL